MYRSILAFNGERTDPVSQRYHLGNGYRTYSQVLQRFHCPDSLSPFSAGGIHPYLYCNADPINHADPSGHLSWQAGVGLGLGVIGLLGAAFSAGTSLVAAGSLASMLSGASTTSLILGTSALIADATGIAGAATEQNHPRASAILGWVSFAAGLLSFGVAAKGGYSALRRGLSPLTARLVRINGRIGLPMSGEFRNARFLGMNHTEERVWWNFRFEDDVPLGRRLTIVMGSEWVGQNLQAINEIWLGGRWQRRVYTQAMLRNMAIGENERFNVYRLAMADSATPRGALRRSASFGSRFSCCLESFPPVVGYRGVPYAAGPVASVLEHALDRASLLHVTGMGELNTPELAQNVLNTISGFYHDTPGALTFHAPVTVYPVLLNNTTNMMNWF